MNAQHNNSSAPSSPTARPKDPTSEAWANKELALTRDEPCNGMQDYFDYNRKQTS